MKLDLQQQNFIIELIKNDTKKLILAIKDSEEDGINFVSQDFNPQDYDYSLSGMKDILHKHLDQVFDANNGQWLENFIRCVRRELLIGLMNISN